MLAAQPNRRTTTLAQLRQALAAARPDNLAKASRAVRVPQAPPHYVAGDLIDDRYLVKARLGAGNFSTVFHVHDTVFEQDVALKLFHPDHGLDTVRRELQALLQVRHPNVVEVIDAGQTSTSPRRWFIKSRLALGTSLQPYVERRNLLDTKRAVSVVDQLLDACSSFHPDENRIAQLKAAASGRDLTDRERQALRKLQERGLVHGDIKPQNVVYDETAGRALLVDFNIAWSPGTPMTSVSGTPGYQPPDADPTSRSVTWDLFALGVLLFELLTGEHPYPNRQPGSGRPQALRSLRPDLPEELERVCATACSPRAAERYASAAEMREELRRAYPSAFAGGDEQPPSPGSPIPRAASTAKPTAARDDRATPTSPLQIGRLVTDEHELKLFVEVDPTSEEPCLVFLATALDGRRYVAPRGARLWLPGRQPLSYEDAANAEWELVIDAVAGESPPSLIKQGETDGSFTLRSKAPVSIDSAPAVVTIHVEENRGDAIVRITCRAPVEVPQVNRGTSVRKPSASAFRTNAGGLAIPDIDEFIESRTEPGTIRAAMAKSFMRRGLEEGEVAASSGRSAKNPDGRTDYMMLHWQSPGNRAAVAYVKPGPGVVDFRLPEPHAASSKYAEVLSPGHREYRVRVRLEDDQSVDDAIELLHRAVRLVAGRESANRAPRSTPPATSNSSPPRRKTQSRVAGSARESSRQPSSSNDDLTRAFHAHMTKLVQRIVKETGYKPTAFVHMLQERGGLAAAQHLLAAPRPSSGFTTLWEMRRLDLTVEAAVLDNTWAGLFDSRELDVARRRLGDC